MSTCTGGPTCYNMFPGSSSTQCCHGPFGTMATRLAQACVSISGDSSCHCNMPNDCFFHYDSLSTDTGRKKDRQFNGYTSFLEIENY